MARLDTIRALEKRGLSTQLAEKTVEWATNWEL